MPVVPGGLVVRAWSGLSTHGHGTDGLETALLIVIAGLLAVVVLAATGWWRRAFAVFSIRPGKMTVEGNGLLVSAPADVERVDAILQSFAGGFNAMICRPSFAGWRRYCDSLPPLCQPFAHEGAAMGFTLRRLFRHDPAAVEERIVRARPGFRYRYYVGLGFWSGMRNHDPQRLARIVDGLDPLYRYLCYDGYGFKQAFFDETRSLQGLSRLEALQGYARNAAHQGVGRAVFFLFMDRPERMVEYIDQLGAYAGDATAGLGLASVFVNPDRIEVARNLGGQLPAAWHDQFHLGVCFGLKARSVNNTDQFERDLAHLEPSVQQAARAAIRECDRIELQVRSERGAEGYRKWRLLVKQWMAEHVEFPLAGLKAAPAPVIAQQSASA